MSSISSLKRCRHCGIEKPLSEFGPRARGKDGLQAQCRVCSRRYAEKYRNNNLEKTRAAAREYQRQHRDQQRANWTQYSEANRERLREAGRQYYWANREAARMRWRNYSALNREWLRERGRDWRQANRERAQQKRLEWGHRTGYDRARSLRRHYQKQRTGTITLDQWHDLCARYNYECLCCGRSEPEIKLTLDHIVPLCRGGVHTIENAQPLCGQCNSRKKDKTIDYRPCG